MSAPSSRTSLPSRIERVGHEVIGAAIEVHRLLGPGLLESVYEEALTHELVLRGLRSERQRPVHVQYKVLVIRGQRIDMVVEDCVIVELKSIASLLEVHAAQLLTYLRISNLALGFLMNFNVPVLRSGIRRLVNERAIPKEPDSLSPPDDRAPRDL